MMDDRDEGRMGGWVEEAEEAEEAEDGIDGPPTGVASPTGSTRGPPSA